MNQTRTIITIESDTGDNESVSVAVHSLAALYLNGETITVALTNNSEAEQTTIGFSDEDEAKTAYDVAIKEWISALAK